MSKRRRQGCRCNSGKRPRPDRRQKHLYLVLDDWDKGFSIHKLDVHSFFLSDDSDSDSDSDDTGELRRLADPPALRLTDSCCTMLFAALGSSIFIADREDYSAHAAVGALVYDTEKAAMAMGPRLPENLCGVFIVAAAGEKQQQQKLYALAYENQHAIHRPDEQHLLRPVRFHVLSRAPFPAAILEPWLPSHEWSWESVPSPPAPFDGNNEIVISYAVHPDGHTIFFSTTEKCAPRRDIGTYSFDTKRCEWRSHGEWMLPFQGQGYFERELDAWVGLQKDGYICCCQAASRSGTPGAPPDWRKTEHKLFRKADQERHLCATLTSIGNNRFCVVESVVREGMELTTRSPFRKGDDCALYVTLFGLKYSREGELQATFRRTTNSYMVPKYRPCFTHVPFWM